MAGAPPTTEGDGKFRWLANWENRQQAKFDRQQAEWPAKKADYAARNVPVASPSGRRYVVRAVPMGTSFFVRGGEIGEFILTIGARGKRSRWAVGVVRDSLWFNTLVCKEYLPDGADEKARVAEIAHCVSGGNLVVRNRERPAPNRTTGETSWMVSTRRCSSFGIMGTTYLT